MTKTIGLVKELITNTRFKLANETTVKDIANICEAYHAQAPLQGELVAWRQTVHVEEVGIKSIKYLYNDEKIMVDDKPLYLATPSTEALQKDKAELVEYARHLRYQLELIDNYRLDLQFTVGSNFERAYTTARYGLSIPQPKCME